MKLPAEIETPPKILWRQCLEAMVESGDILETSAMEASPDHAAEAVDYLMMTLSSAYILMARADPDYPEFLPWVNALFPYGGTNPDGTYYYTTLDGGGIYRIYGHRNTVHYVDFLTGYDFWGFAEQSGRSFPSKRISDFAIDADGSFEILLSGERPAEHRGNWMRLEPEANYLVIRQFAYRPEEVDVRMAIERTDRAGPRKMRHTEEARSRVEQVVRHLRTSSRTWPAFLRRLKDGEVINRFGIVQYGGTGETRGQVYHEGLYRIRLDQALLIEVTIPVPCNYWNIQIADLFWRTLDFMNRQSTLNGFRDRSDPDGVLRIVVSHRDPGVDNWIDAQGVTEGELLMRWQDVDKAPEPCLSLIPWNELHRRLHPATARVTPEAREANLRQWTRARQLRRSW